MIIELKEINKSYQYPGNKNRRDVLKNINLNIKSGDSIAIVGPSGSGKSTLLNIIGTLDNPTSGNVIFNNQDITSFDEKKLAQIRNQQIGFVFQEHHLLPHLTLLENVLVPTIPIKDKNKVNKAKKRALELIDSVGLSENINQFPGQLSGGECQRAAVIRALINEPELVLADEPTGSLDHESAENLSELLIKINKEHKVAMIVVTHSQTLASKMNVSYKLMNGGLQRIN